MKFACVVMCLAGAALAGCGTLPTAGPSASQVVDQAMVNGRPRFDLVDVNEHVVSTLLAQPAASFRNTFWRYGKPPNPKIQIGDTIEVSIWEAAGGGLFGGAATAAPVTTQTTTTAAAISGGSQKSGIPDQVVAPDGGISVPFAGRIPVAGHTPLEVQHIIEQRLSEKTIEPQVIVTVVKSERYSATVSGEVVNGARVPLSVAGDRLLDLIAEAGGAKAPIYETFVRLTRGGVTVTIPMVKLVSDPSENIYAWPGDVLTLIQVPRTFTVFGAAGQNNQIPFGAQRVTVADALAKSGGLQDSRADPSGVFLFRFEPARVVGALKARSLPIGPGGSSPVVYRFNLDDVDSYFLAQRFPIENKDIIYIANAPLTQLQKFFTLLSTITSPVVTGAVVKNATTP
ncbi:MAG TPA: polysaccharide biosynthesis/export family protein [Stellaceae bacterium]|jgi:polysaccharide biosynthesis/export protein|nr:polysaccharide biosynthesis/export family protein [Stellaceae bacterium]